MIDSKIMETTKSILKDFGHTYFSDKGTLKRNKVVEDLDAYTPMLMKTLLANQLIHDTYTESIVIDDKSVELFKLNQFIEMFTYKEYWQDSYTKFENKIGLTAGGKFIDESADVVLDFPFKDTVLKAGMTKEDQKDTDEPFLHETIAKAEIDQLLEPKIFVNATKYDQEHLIGEVVDDFDNDNLIIKGNNLIALYSLKERYAGRVKLIYLDPPYNTKHDSFEYNDNYSRSAWLTFVKNRLEIAKSLLDSDGVVTVQIDDHEQAYLKVLMDSIFGELNFISTVVIKGGSGRQDSNNFAKTHEFILVYAKDINYFELNAKESEIDLSTFKKFDKSGKPYKTQLLRKWGNNDRREDRPNLYYPIEFEGKTYYPINSSGEDGRWRWEPSKVKKGIENGEIIAGTSKDGKPELYQKVFPDESGIKKTTFASLIENNLSDSYSGKGTRELNKLFGKSPFATPKSEIELKQLLDMFTAERDIVLDFFMGSATTQAVAMKMNRRFIGIEQMDYIKTVSVERLKKVIAGEQGGISKDVNWQGGGSFVYAELMEKNQGYLKDVQQAETTKELEDVVNRMIEGGADFDFRVDVEKVLQDPEYQAMVLADKKQLIVKVIDKNQLYYAYSDMEDRDVQELMSESDIAFNKSFYGERDL